MKTPDPVAFINSAEFSEFIAQGAAKITPATVHRLVALLPDMQAEFSAVEAPGFPQAPAQLAFLSQVVGAFADDRCPDVTYTAASEAAFALLYLAREVDLIPDVVEGIGYLDDAAVAATVLQRHAEEFGRFAAAEGADWKALDPSGGK